MTKKDLIERLNKMIQTAQSRGNRPVEYKLINTRAMIRRLPDSSTESFEQIDRALTQVGY